MAVLWTGCGSILEAFVTALGAESGARSARRLAVQRRRCWGMSNEWSAAGHYTAAWPIFIIPLLLEAHIDILIIFFFPSLGYWTLADVF